MDVSDQHAGIPIEVWPPDDCNDDDNDSCNYDSRYVQDLAEDIVENLHQSPSPELWRRLSSRIPFILKYFALKLGYGWETPETSRIMSFMSFLYTHHS
jgi:hypothetical protein